MPRLKRQSACSGGSRATRSRRASAKLFRGTRRISIKCKAMEEFYRHKRVLVTGAGGFIGSALVSALEKMGADVFAALGPRKQTWRLAHVKADVTLLEGNLTNPEELKRI